MNESLKAREMVEKVIPYSKRIERIPKRVTKELLAILAEEGLTVAASPNPYDAAKQIREAGNRIVILPLEHRITQEEGNRIVKAVNPQNYLYLDSARTIEAALELSKDYATKSGKKWSLPGGLKPGDISRLTDTVCEMSGMHPYFLIKADLDERGEDKNPAIGFYWIGGFGSDIRPRVVTWMRAINGHDFFREYREGRFPMKLDKAFYGGNNMKFTVPSDSDKKRVYNFWLTHLPIFTKDDRRKHSYWRKLETSDNNPDAGYKGLAQRNREPSSLFFTSYAISGYDAAADRLRKSHELGNGMEIQISPFPMLTKNGEELVRLLGEQTLIGNKPLSMTEKEPLIGADTKNNGYGHNFFHWTK